MAELTTEHSTIATTGDHSASQHVQKGMPMPIRSDGITTRGGLQLPPFGFGTYKLTGKYGADVMAAALDAGYRLLDSAASYENEAAVGAAVRRSGVSRSEIVVTSKLAGRNHASDDATDAIERSVLRTGLDHIDLFLIHWPNPRRDQFVEAWQALINARDRGLVGHIGVCNFTAEHIDRLIRETGVFPEVNQVELHPYFNQQDLLAYHRNHNASRWGGARSGAVEPFSSSPLSRRLRLPTAPPRLK